MLDDYSQMEKKPSGRSVLPASKAGGTESKKNSGPNLGLLLLFTSCPILFAYFVIFFNILDAISKPFGKYNRRREPIVYNNPKNEPPRKCNSSKGGKYADKRPKPRNQFLNCGKEDTKVLKFLFLP